MSIDNLSTEQKVQLELLEKMQKEEMERWIRQQLMHGTGQKDIGTILEELADKVLSNELINNLKNGMYLTNINIGIDDDSVEREVNSTYEQNTVPVEKREPEKSTINYDNTVDSSINNNFTPMPEPKNVEPHQNQYVNNMGVGGGKNPWIKECEKAINKTELQIIALKLSQSYLEQAQNENKYIDEVNVVYKDGKFTLQSIANGEVTSYEIDKNRAVEFINNENKITFDSYLNSEIKDRIELKEPLTVESNKLDNTIDDLSECNKKLYQIKSDLYTIEGNELKQESITKNGQPIKDEDFSKLCENVKDIENINNLRGATLEERNRNYLEDIADMANRARQMEKNFDTPNYEMPKVKDTIEPMPNAVEDRTQDNIQQPESEPVTPLPEYSQNVGQEQIEMPQPVTSPVTPPPEYSREQQPITEAYPFQQEQEIPMSPVIEDENKPIQDFSRANKDEVLDEKTQEDNNIEKQNDELPLDGAEENKNDNRFNIYDREIEKNYSMKDMLKSEKKYQEKIANGKEVTKKEKEEHKKFEDMQLARKYLEKKRDGKEPSLEEEKAFLTTKKSSLIKENRMKIIKVAAITLGTAIAGTALSVLTGGLGIGVCLAVGAASGLMGGAVASDVLYNNAEHTINALSISKRRLIYGGGPRYSYYTQDGKRIKQLTPVVGYSGKVAKEQQQNKKLYDLHNKGYKDITIEQVREIMPRSVSELDEKIKDIDYKIETRDRELQNTEKKPVSPAIQKQINNIGTEKNIGPKQYPINEKTLQNSNEIGKEKIQKDNTRQDI